MSDNSKAGAKASAPEVQVANVTDTAEPVARGIPSEGREIGEHAMRPYVLKVKKPNGKFVTYQSM